MSYELELIYFFAKAWNTYDSKVIEPYISNDIVYESQSVVEPLVGKEDVLAYLEGKMRTIKNAGSEYEIFYEVGTCGSQSGYEIQISTAYEGRPCVLTAQGGKDDLDGIVLLECEEAQIMRIDICTEYPHVSTVKRTGVYPS